jgi:preprotein translocase subunit SecG
VFGLLLAILILDGIFLMVVVLLQAGKGGGLAAMGGGGGGTDNFIGGRQAATLLTKSTWTAGAIFLSLALILSIMSVQARTPESILQREFQTAPAAPQPLLPGTEPAPEGAVPLQPGPGAAPPAGEGTPQP